MPRTMSHVPILTSKEGKYRHKTLFSKAGLDMHQLILFFTTIHIINHLLP